MRNSKEHCGRKTVRWSSSGGNFSDRQTIPARVDWVQKLSSPGLPRLLFKRLRRKEIYCCSRCPILLVQIAILRIWNVSFSAAGESSGNGKITFVPTKSLIREHPSEDPSQMTRTMEQVGAGLEKIVAGSLRRAPAGQGPLLAWAI